MPPTTPATIRVLAHRAIGAARGGTWLEVLGTTIPAFPISIRLGLLPRPRGRAPNHITPVSMPRTSPPCGPMFIGIQFLRRTGVGALLHITHLIVSYTHIGSQHRGSMGDYFLFYSRTVTAVKGTRVAMFGASPARGPMLIAHVLLRLPHSHAVRDVALIPMLGTPPAPGAEIIFIGFRESRSLAPLDAALVIVS